MCRRFACADQDAAFSVARSQLAKCTWSPGPLARGGERRRFLNALVFILKLYVRFMRIGPVPWAKCVACLRHVVVLGQQEHTTGTAGSSHVNPELWRHMWRPFKGTPPGRREFEPPADVAGATLYLYIAWELEARSGGWGIA
jgi:hypothetical protein